jgi:hypothetical protein
MFSLPDFLHIFNQLQDLISFYIFRKKVFPIHCNVGYFSKSVFLYTDRDFWVKGSSFWVIKTFVNCNVWIAKLCFLNRQVQFIENHSVTPDEFPTHSPCTRGIESDSKRARQDRQTDTEREREREREREKERELALTQKNIFSKIQTK